MVTGTRGGGASGGAAWVFLGPTTGTVTREDADITFEATPSTREAGTSTAMNGDMDGTGDADPVIGAPGASSSAGIRSLLRSFGL